MKKKHAEHVNLERWLVSYADFITLLFAFFVVMYAISQADMAKFKKVSASMKEAFHVQTGGPVEFQGGGIPGGNSALPFQQPDSSGGRVLNMPTGKTHTQADQDSKLQEVKELLEETMSLELGVANPAEALQMHYDARGLVLRLAVNGFFERGSAEVPQDLRPILDRIGRVLATTDRLIRIEGHTDRTEAETPGYPSDWELSAARAAWVAKYWIKRHNLNPQRVGVAGYSHFRPLGDSKTEVARARNRRIEIILPSGKADLPPAPSAEQ